MKTGGLTTCWLWFLTYSEWTVEVTEAATIFEEKLEKEGDQRQTMKVTDEKSTERVRLSVGIYTN